MLVFTSFQFIFSFINSFIEIVDSSISFTHDKVICLPYVPSMLPYGILRVHSEEYLVVPLSEFLSVEKREFYCHYYFHQDIMIYRYYIALTILLLFFMFIF